MTEVVNLFQAWVQLILCPTLIKSPLSYSASCAEGILNIFNLHMSEFIIYYKAELPTES